MVDLRLGIVSAVALMSVAVLCAGGAGPAAGGRAATRPADVEGFAVVELFTSEGCSSCPVADDVLSELARNARKRGVPVFALAFHVDYWDGPGWRDRFSSAAYSERQRAYVEALGVKSAYTPEVVVNGRAEFVGADRAKLAGELSRALRARAGAAVKLEVKAGEGRGAVEVKYHVTGAVAKGSRLNVAVVERGLETSVTGGENARRTLRHENVVRAFESVALEGNDGRVRLVLPGDVVAGNVSVVGYVQDGGMKVLGAAGVEVGDEKVGK